MQQRWRPRMGQARLPARSALLRLRPLVLLQPRRPQALGKALDFDEPLFAAQLVPGEQVVANFRGLPVVDDEVEPFKFGEHGRDRDLLTVRVVTKVGGARTASDLYPPDQPRCGRVDLLDLGQLGLTVGLEFVE